jgi:hypothetical protein
MKRFAIGGAALAVLLTCSLLLARPGTLKTKSGQVYTGDITETDDAIVVTMNNIQTQIARSDVASISYTGSVDEQYNQKLAALAANDAPGRVKLAKFAFDNGRNDLALQAVSAALQIDPNNVDAVQMLKTVEAQRALENQHAAGAGDATPVVPPTTPPDAAEGAGEQSPGAGQVPRRLLTSADINAIRQREIGPHDDIPISIPADLRRKFAAHIGVAYSDFDALSNREQFQQILDKGDPEMKAAVKINRDPHSILQFKKLIQPMVLRNCATSNCHGGWAGGSFILYNGNDTATTYTNFYIMEQFAMKTAGGGGFFGSGAQRKMIERGDGAHSLLVDFGLPAGQGEVSHPPVPNSAYNGIFRGRDDRLYRLAVDWMNNDLNAIEPNYGIQYTPPAAPTSRPATQP